MENHCKSPLKEGFYLDLHEREGMGQRKNGARWIQSGYLHPTLFLLFLRKGCDQGWTQRCWHLISGQQGGPCPQISLRDMLTCGTELIEGDVVVRMRTVSESSSSLNVWFPIVRATWESLWGVALLEGVCSWKRCGLGGELWGFKSLD